MKHSQRETKLKRTDGVYVLKSVQLSPQFVGELHTFCSFASVTTTVDFK